MLRCNLRRSADPAKRGAAVRVASALFPFWVAVGFLVPAVFGWLLAGGWMGALLGLLWGGLVRVFLVHRFHVGVLRGTLIRLG